MINDEYVLALIMCRNLKTFVLDWHLVKVFFLDLSRRFSTFFSFFNRLWQFLCDSDSDNSLDRVIRLLFLYYFRFGLVAFLIRFALNGLSRDSSRLIHLKSDLVDPCE